MRAYPCDYKQEALSKIYSWNEIKNQKDSIAQIYEGINPNAYFIVLADRTILYFYADGTVLEPAFDSSWNECRFVIVDNARLCISIKKEQSHDNRLP